MKIIKLNQKSANRAANVIKQGGVVIFPTDTVYGFLAGAENKKAVAKIFRIKKRAKSKTLPVFIKDFKMAENLAEINKKQEKILKKYWPGKYTFVLNKKDKKGTIALRIPKYKLLNNLLKKINKPLMQTSVNISGQPALTKISDIIKQFNKYDILIVNGGDFKNNKSSKIIDLTKEKIEFLRN